MVLYNMCLISTLSTNFLSDFEEPDHVEDNHTLLSLRTLDSEEGVIGTYWHFYSDGWNRMQEKLGVSSYQRGRRSEKGIT